MASEANSRDRIVLRERIRDEKRRAPRPRRPPRAPAAPRPRRWREAAGVAGAAASSGAAGSLRARSAAASPGATARSCARFERARSIEFAISGSSRTSSGCSRRYSRTSSCVTSSVEPGPVSPSLHAAAAKPIAIASRTRTTLHTFRAASRLGAFSRAAAASVQQAYLASPAVRRSVARPDWR